jgi:hypothetical protein
MVLNEHSLCAPDVDRARVWMTELAETIQQISQICGGQAAKFWTQKQVGSTLLTRDYRDRDYALRTYLFGDQTVKNNKKQKAQRDYLQSLLTRTPYWDEQPEPRASQHPDIDEMEFIHNNQTCAMCGLGFTYLRDALAIGLPSDPCWQVDKVLLKVISLSTISNSVPEEIVEIIHASLPIHITAHENWIKNRLRSDIKDGADLWEHRITFFPSLIFCTNVERQIQTLSPTMLGSVVGRLFDLQAHCERWTRGRFNTDGLLGNPRPESPATLQMFGQERTFRCPDNQERVFSWHVSLAGSWRLYFLPQLESETEKMIIGYVGPHLSTVRHR